MIKFKQATLVAKHLVDCVFFFAAASVVPLVVEFALTKGHLGEFLVMRL